MDFRIEYAAPSKPIGEPERYEGYDADSALYAFVRAGAEATMVVGPTRLPMRDVNFVDLVHSSLEIGEQLAACAPSTFEEVRARMPELPPDTRIYAWYVVDYVDEIPLIIFATDAETVRIYTRTYMGANRDVLSVGERDRVEPVTEPRDAVVAEIHSFLSRVFDDLAAAFPFLADDELYLRRRQRIAALAPR
ncbi:MAG TPA: hypothetical protein VNA69_09770 [Thermoanaerobaculia bacterium]|nr:hypothetical protein [Thermoanaerobaculia bacterium]